MSEYIRRIDEADKAVREAKRALNNAEKEREKKLKQIGKEIRECEDYIAKPQKTYAGISLYIDHLEYQKQSFVLNENTFAEVITSGQITTAVSTKSGNGISVGGAVLGGMVAGPLGAVAGGVKHKTKVKTEEVDHRKLYIHVSTDEGEFTAETKPDEETKARQFVNDINNFAMAAEQEVEGAQNNLDYAREKLRTAEADFTEINKAADILEEKQNAKRAIEASSSLEEREQLTARNKKRQKMILAAAAAVIVIVAAVLFSRPKKDNTPEPQPAAAVSAEPEKTPAPTPTPEPTPAPTPEATPEPTAQTAAGIRLEFRQSMEAYEAFFDEYVAFMKDIDEDNVSLDQMGRYLEFLNKYSEAMEALDAIDESTLTPEEDRLYTETLIRIDQKLLEAID